MDKYKFDIHHNHGRDYKESDHHAPPLLAIHNSLANTQDPKSGRYKPTETPRRFHRSQTKTTITGMSIVTLAFTAQLCQGKKLSAQRFATLIPVTKAGCSKPPINQVVLHTPLFCNDGHQYSTFLAAILHSHSCQDPRKQTDNSEKTHLK